HSALRGLALLQSSFGLSTSKLRRYFSVLPANSDLSSPSLMATFTQRIQRNYVERYALVVYRQSSCIELSFDAHFLEFVALSLVWAESFERQAGFEVWLELDNSSIYHDLFGYGSLLLLAVQFIERVSLCFMVLSFFLDIHCT